MSHFFPQQIDRVETPLADVPCQCRGRGRLIIAPQARPCRARARHAPHYLHPALQHMTICASDSLGFACSPAPCRRYVCPRFLACARAAPLAPSIATPLWGVVGGGDGMAVSKG